MKRLTEDDVREIQQIHTSWIEFEVAGEDRRLLALCADGIEFWPPDAPPVLGRTAISAQLASGNFRYAKVSSCRHGTIGPLHGSATPSTGS